MTTTHLAKIYPLTVAATETRSRVVSASEYSDAVLISITAPASLQGSITRSIRVSQDGVVWSFLTDAGGAVALPAAGESRTYYEMISFPFWEIHYSAGPTLSEVWRCAKSWSVS